MEAAGAEVGELDYGGDKARDCDSLRHSFDRAVVDFVRQVSHSDHRVK